MGLTPLSPESLPKEGYTAEYMQAFDRGERLGLRVPPRILVRKPCVDVERTLPVLLDYFDEHEPEELMGQTLAIHWALIPRLYDATKVLFELTIGWCEIKGRTFFRHDEETIRRFLKARAAASQREGVPFHIWLTSPALEVLDVTFAMNSGWAKTRERCAQLIIYKPPESEDDPVYHPMVVGEDFLLQTGLVIDFSDQR
jgi:hypothetical protein